MSVLYDWMYMRGNEWHVAARPLIDSLSKAIPDLVNVCKGAAWSLCA